MPITKQKKEALVSELDDLLKDSKSVVFVRFNRLSVADTTLFRRNLRGAAVGYKVAKKTLMKRVLGTKSVTGTMPELPGEIALAYSTDALAPAREVYAFAKEHKDNVEIVGGVFESKYFTKDEMMSIATIPPIQVLYGQFVNLINSPIQRLAVVMNEIAKAKA